MDLCERLQQLILPTFIEEFSIEFRNGDALSGASRALSRCQRPCADDQSTKSRLKRSDPLSVRLAADHPGTALSV